MPTFVHGKGAHFELTDSGSSTRDISNTAEDVSFPQTVATADVTSFGNNSQAYIVGLKDSKITVKGSYDATVEGYLFGLLGVGFTTWIYGPAGSATGKVKYTGSAIVTQYNEDSPVAGKVTYQLDLQVSGDVTKTTFP